MNQLETFNRAEREAMLVRMQAVSNRLYAEAVGIGCHPFIEFVGLINEYINCCRQAQERGIDFTNCNTHTGDSLPMESYQVAYINEKLECIFTGRSVVTHSDGKGRHT